MGGDSECAGGDRRLLDGDGTPLTRIFVAAGFIWLLVMVDLTLSDYLTRGSVPGAQRKTWEHGAWPAPTNALPR